MSLGRTSMLAVAAGLAASIGGVPQSIRYGAAAVSNAVRHQLQKHSAIDARDPKTTFGYLRGPGWSAAHVKRMARKNRNRARHKAAVRRAR